MRSRGFTLIELLVVIAIIGLLASIVLTSLSSARSKGRDAKREAQVQEFEKALDLYYSLNGHYPCNDSLCTVTNTGVNSFVAGSIAGTALVSSGVISSIPNDPLYPNSNCNGTGGVAGYCYCTDSKDSYVLTVNTEDDKGGSDQCYIDVGSKASTFCTGHQILAGTVATDPCSSRF